MPDHRSSEGYQTHFAQRRQIEQEAQRRSVMAELKRENDYFAARLNEPDGPEACWKAGHVPGCPCRAGGDVELREGWISYEDEDGITVEVEVKG